jgi:uncharacterized repeat protein (TIGR01451 family)
MTNLMLWTRVCRCSGVILNFMNIDFTFSSYGSICRLALIALLASVVLTQGQNVREDFSTDPAAAGRFVQTTTDTESSITYNSTSQNLTALLDVDLSPAYYLSKPFAPLTDAMDSSFSAEFRVEAIDDQFTPTGFIGLLTGLHVEDFGDGLSLLLSTDNGRLIARANIDANDFRAAGSTIPLDLRRDYLAVGRYQAVSRQFAVEIYDGSGFTNLVGFSVTTLPAGRTLRLDRIGLQNGGAENFDRPAGSITITVDNLSTPGSNPNSFSISDTTVTERSSGTTEAVFTVRLFPASSQTAIVDYSTADGTAKAGVDFVGKSGKLTFPPGITSATILVPILGDTLIEDNETFFVTLTNAIGSTIGRSQALGTILDDDPPPALSIEGASVIEGDSGSANKAVFTVSLSAESTRTVSVTYSTSDGTATNALDYIRQSGTLIFPPGVTVTNISVPIIGDLIVETNATSIGETFFVNLSNPSNSTLAKPQALGTIVDDDGARLISIADASVIEGSEGTTTQAVFNVTLNRPHTLPVTVEFAAASGTATVGTDLLARSGTLVIPPGATQTNIAVTVLGDRFPEPDEAFILSLSNPINAGLAVPRATGTITNDDRFPRLLVSDVTVVEGNSGTTAAVFGVQLSFAAVDTVTVNYVTVDGTAKAGSDYVQTSSTVTFPAGITNQTITVRINGDTLNEPDETLFVELSASTNAIIEDGQGLATILNDDSLPQLSIHDVTVAEPDTGTVDAVFAVALSAPSGQEVRVSFSTTDGSANAGSDYNNAFGTLIFPAGTTQQTLRVAVRGDTAFEGDETFLVNLSDPLNATILDSQGVAIIVDNDGMPVLSINDVIVTERPGGTNAVFKVTLSNATRNTVTVDFSTSDGTTRAGTDYVSTSSTLTFLPGATTQTISVSILDDLLDEDDETFFLNLSNASAATLADSQGQGTIRDNDPAPSISIADVRLLEGDDGQTNAVFSVILSAPSTRAISVAYATSDGTAKAGEDYLAASGTINLPPGSTSSTLAVVVLGDIKVEPDETFLLNLSNPVNADLARNTILGTILDDDNRGFSIDDVTVVEGNLGTTTNAIFTLILAKPSLNTVSVNFTTIDGTATAGVDYRATNGLITFAPGETRRTISVSVIGDSQPELDEDFFLVLSNVVHGSLGRDRIRGTIIDDDLEIKILTDSFAVTAESCGLPNNAIDPYERVTVNFVLVNKGNIPTKNLTATLLATNGVTPFSGAQTYGVVAPNGAAVARPFTFMLNGQCGQPSAAVLQLRDGTTDLGTISFPFTLGVNAAGVLVCCSQADLAISASDSPDPLFVGESLTYRVVVTNHGPLDARQVSLTNRLAGGLRFISAVTSQGQSTNQNDLVTCQLGDLTAGGTANITITVTPQTAGRLISIFQVTSPSDDPDRSNNTAVVDTDVRLPVGISLDEISIVEGDRGTTNATFTLRLSPATGRTITVDYQTIDGTATAGSDYVAKSGTLTFPPGVTLTNITVQVVGDTLVEDNETFSIGLSNPVNAPLAPGRERAFATIIDDDETCVTIADIAVIEPDPGSTTEALLTLSLSLPSDRAVTVDYMTTDGTATAGADYIGKTGLITFQPGTTSVALAITVPGDSQREIEETFFVHLSNAINARLCRDQAVVRIHEEPVPSVSIADASINERDAGTKPALFLVNLSAPSSKTVLVDYSTADGTAQAGSDYLGQSGTLTFSPGTVQREVSVIINEDTSPEANETFFVNLSNPRQATLAKMQATGTILNDDDFPPLVVADTARLVSENCPPGNGAIDPLETVTLNLALKNLGLGSVTNLIATLLRSDGVLPVSGPQTYGSLAANGSTVTRPFTLMVDHVCGESFSATLELRDGGRTLPSVRFSFTVGLNTNGQFVCCQSADVAVSVTHQPEPVVLGETLVYTVTVTNRGPSQAFGVMLTNKLDSGLRFQTATSRGASFTNTGELVICPLGNLAPGSAAQVQLTARAERFGFATSLFLISKENDPDISNNTTADAVQVVPPTGISISNATVLEGGAANVTVRLYPARGQPVSVVVSTADGTATSGADYTPLTGARVSFPPGVTATNVTVTTLDDALDEPDEFFVVRLSNPVGAPIAVSELTVTIVDNDLPCLSIDDVDVNVGLSGDAQAILTVSLSSPSDRVVSVNYATADGVATAGTDYVPKFGTISFPPGVISTNLTIIVSGNTADEGIEHFFVNLGQPENATLCDPQGKVTITDENPGFITVNDVSVIEGDAGTTQAVFVLRLAQPQRFAASVEYSTSDSTARAGSDYVFANGTVTFQPGVTQTNINVQVLGDLVSEQEETFFLNLLNPRNARLSRNQATGTILNDDPMPRITISGASVREGNIGLTNALFAAGLSNPSSEAITLSVATLDGTALAGIDYGATNRTLVFQPGQTNLVFAVAVSGDTLDEPDETFFARLSLSIPANATLLVDQAQGTIIDDDDPPLIAIESASVKEGDLGLTNAVFVLTLSAASGKTVSVNYATANGTATANSDFQPRSGSLTIPPGQTSATVIVPVIGDPLPEPDETFFLNLSNPVDATLAKTQAVGTILNDDNAPPTVSITNPVNGAAFTVGTNILIEATASDPDGSVAKVGFFQGNISLGEDSTVPYSVIWSNVAAGTYTLTATATDNRGATATSGPVNITVSSLPSLTINDASVLEGNSGTTNTLFTVSLSAPSVQPVTVDYTTSNGSATAGSDYEVRFGTVTFPSGQTSVAISVPVIGDELPEPDETFFLNFSNAVNATLAKLQAVGTIRNDDNTPPAVSITNPANNATFTVGTNILIEATASDPDGTVAKVEFLQGNTKLGEDSTAPYGMIWSNVASGRYTLTAKATDNKGATGTSDPVTISVIAPTTPGNIPPTVSIVSPADRTIFQDGEPISIEAQARDPDGRVERVEFFAGPSKLGEVSTLPYRLRWVGAKEGHYVLTARAVDDKGATGDSAPVRIVVSRACTQVAIVRNFEDPEIPSLVEYLYEIGVKAFVFDRLEATREATIDAQLEKFTNFGVVIWHDVGRSGLSEREVNLFDALANPKLGKGLYYIGDALVSSAQQLTPAQRSQWFELIHLTAQSGLGAPPTRVALDIALGDAVVGPRGKVGTVQDFNYPFLNQGVEQTHSPEELIWGRAGSSDVLVAFEKSTTGVSGRRVTQAFRVANGGDDASKAERKKLFQNAVWWLMKCVCDNLNMTILDNGSPTSANVGEELTYSLKVSQAGGCEALFVTASNVLPPGLKFLEASSEIGEWAINDGVVSFALGKLARGAEVNLKIRAQFLQGGVFTNAWQMRSLNESDGAHHDNSVEIVTRVEGPGESPLTLSAKVGVGGSIELTLRGTPDQTVVVETSADLRTWTPIQTVVLTGGRSVFLDITSGISKARFYRATPRRL